MSNSYVHCCAEIEALSPEEAAWLTEQLGQVEIVSSAKIYEPGEHDWVGPRFLCEELDEDGEVIVGQGFKAEFVGTDDNCRLFISADEGFSPYTLVILVHKFLRKFRPTECWGTTYAELTDRDVPDAFGGGYIFVTAQGYVIQCAHERLTQLMGDYKLAKTKKTAWEEVEDLNRRMEELRKTTSKHWVWGGFDPTNLPSVQPRNADDPQAPEVPPEG